MNEINKISAKGQELIEMYKIMANNYKVEDGSTIKNGYDMFNAGFYKDFLLSQFSDYDIKTLLDYGCGGSDWNDTNFTKDKKSAINFFRLDKVYRYEPARYIDERKLADCVICFDVLEHIFLSDIPNFVRDIFRYAKKLVILNVACYPARALLPNGENAHITVRHGVWWKGLVDCISTEFPDINICLMYSDAYLKTSIFKNFKDKDRLNSNTFVCEN